VPRNRVGTVGDGLKPSPTKNTIHRSWTDEFGTLVATLEGRSGGRNIMVIAPLESASDLLPALQTLPSFKGRIFLAILEHLHAAPLEAVIKANNPNIVIALEEDCAGIAIRGEATTTKAEQITSSTGTTYLELGQYEAWTSGFLEEQLNTPLEHPSIAASVASGLKIPCAACDLGHLPRLLERLLI
jgi:hypothetical protein